MAEPETDRKPDEDPAPSPHARPVLVTALVAALIGGIAVVRQGERDALRLGDEPRATPPAAEEPYPEAWGRPEEVPSAASAVVPVAPPTTLPSSPPPFADREPPAPAALDEAARAAFADAQPEIVACVRAERETRAEARGKLAVKVLIDSRGFVGAVAFAPSAVRSETFDDCARVALLAIVFPEEMRGREVEMTYDMR